ncbi:MAG: MFS transporter [Nocardioides sp.]|jgi:MFS family permease
MTNAGDESAFRLREIAVYAYAPTLISAIGYGATAPIIALLARDLGASVGVAAFVVALAGIGMFLTSLPAGALVARIGERTALMIAAAVDVVANVVAATASSVWVLGAATLVGGAAWTVFLIARQGFMIDVVPFAMRARAMSALGGTFRIGLFIGPLIGAALIHWWSLSAAWWLAAVMSVLAGLVASTMPDLGQEGRAAGRESGFHSVRSVIWAHRRTLATLGVAIIIISASRSVRTTLLPLWADHIGITAAATSLVFALVALIDIVMFYPGGLLMDRYGRMVVAVPVVLGVAVAALALPGVRTLAGLAIVMSVIAVSNGLSSGIALTIGADTAPTEGRAQYLGGWRLCGDIGGTGGPLLVSALAAAFSLASAAIAVGVLAFLGAGWVAYWTHRLDAHLRVSRSSP